MQRSFFTILKPFANAVFLLLAFCLYVVSAEKEKVSFNSDIRPILSDKCYFCHGQDAKDIKGKLQLHTFELATSDRKGKGAAIVPGNPEKSLLWQRITTKDEDDVMPPPERHMKITDKEAALIRTWIEQGAQYQQLWSLEPLPKIVDVPPAVFPGARNEIDHFVQRRLKKEGLEPAKEAESETLLRRLYLTLTGLLPTPEQIAEFKADKSEKAYENTVDKLLKSDAFAERLALDWMDVARYSDTYGYQRDFNRNVSLWRDWVIQAFKHNLPYDQFIIQQLAGDLLPHATDDIILATTFNRLHGMEVEGGSIPEEYRTEYVADRAQTTATAFMGLTLECCRCHDHKYDPISMKDYYRTFALFNNIDEAGLLAFFETSVPSPTLTIMNDEQKATLAKHKQAAENAYQHYINILQKEETGFSNWKKSWTGEVTTPGKLAEFTFDEIINGKVMNAVVLSGENLAHGTDGGKIHIKDNEITIQNPKLQKEGVDSFTIQLMGDKRSLQVGEIELYVEGKNVINQSTITQSSQSDNEEPADKLTTDGDKETLFISQIEKNPWIKVSFTKPVNVDEIKIYIPEDKLTLFHDAGLFFKNGKKNLSKMTISMPGGRTGVALGSNKIVDGMSGKAAAFDGDTELKLGEIGPFARHAPFSISVSIEMPIAHKRAIILHRSQAWTDAGSRGYELLIHEGKLDFALIHFSPGNEIRVRTKQDIPLNTWTRVAMTYDGSGRAAGIKLHLNGEVVPVDIIRDNLNKEIHYAKGRSIELAARFRDSGFKNSKIDDVAIFDRELTDLEVRSLHIKNAKPKNEAELLAYYQATQSKAVAEAVAELAQAREVANKYLDGMARMMVMAELPERRKTYVLKRGLYSDPDLNQEVEPGPPEKIFPFGKEYTRDRLGFAQWLTHPDHPLTARVTVNRYWQLIFGSGIVKTTNDFGFQGAMPTYPDLLNYLSRRFIDSGWDVAEIFKYMVTSATFRQDSSGSNKLLDADPENKILARGPSYYMSAEMLRDSSFIAGGWLNLTIGGHSTSIESNRRSLYVNLRRNDPPPELVIFGTPPRHVCTVKREATSTPLQPLVLLNSPLYVKNARMVAAAALSKYKNSEDIIRDIFLRLTSRQLTADEQIILLSLLKEQQVYFSKVPDVTKNYLMIGGGGKQEKNVPPHELAAWASVASAVMNLDSFYMVR